ncbi:MAG: hypothetical protein V1924_00135 [Candidatus Bathyarchaeota archaeon]
MAYLGWHGITQKKNSISCFTGRCKGFRVIEADSEEQLANLIALWWPTEDWKLEVILESQSPVFTKAFQKWSQT